MKDIKSVRLSEMRQEESFGFHQLVNAEFIKCTDPMFADALTAYTTNLAIFDQALKPAGASRHTKKVKELDNQRDNAYRGLAVHIKNTARHFDAAKAEAARKLQSVLDKYGDPTHLPYIQENGTMINLIQDLSGSDSSAWLSAIDGADWLTELARLNAEFIAFFSERNLEQSSIVAGVSKEARNKTDEAYKYCVKRINALSELNGSTAYQSVIDAVNKLIDYEQSVLSARRTRKSHQSEVEN